MYKDQFKKTSAFFERFLGLFRAFFERFLSVFYFYFFSEFYKNALKTLKKRKFEKRSKPLQAAPRFLERFGAFWSVFKNAIAFFARHFFARVGIYIHYMSNFQLLVTFIKAFLPIFCFYFFFQTLPTILNVCTIDVNTNS